MFDPTNFINNFPYLGIFVLLILGAIGLPFPEDTTVMLCGFLVASNVVKPLPSFLVIYIGLLIADFFLYSVGKKYGRRVVEHRRFHRLISPKKLLILEEKFKKRGNFSNIYWEASYRIEGADIHCGGNNEDVFYQISYC